MKLLISKIMLSDRYTLITAALVLLLVVFTFITFISANNLKSENEGLNTQLKEMEMLGEGFFYIKDMIESKEKKIGLTNVSGVVPALEQMLNSMGLEAKIIKPLEKKRTKGFTEEDAELQIENIDLNKIVNLLYKIENSPVPMKIKTAHIKTTFENPNVFILSMTASLIGKPGTTGITP